MDSRAIKREWDRQRLARIGAAILVMVGSLSWPVWPAAADVALTIEQVTTTDGQGRPKDQFLPGEEIQIRVTLRVTLASGNPFLARLRILGVGWYEVLTRELPPVPGVYHVRWGGSGSQLFVSAEAGPGKVALALDGFSEQEPVSASGRRHAYLTIQCPGGLPAGEAARLQVGKYPFAMGLTSERSELYVTSQVDHSITVIDLDEKAVVAQIQDPEKIIEPAGVVAAPDGRTMFVADSASQGVHVIDTQTHVLVETLPLNPTGELGVVQPGALAIEPATNELLVADLRDSRILAMDLMSHLVREIPLYGSLLAPPVGLQPIQILVDPQNPFALYVLCQALSEVIKVDVRGNLIDFVRLRNVTDPSSLWPVWSMAIHPVRGELYVLANPGEFESTYRTMKSRIYVLPKDRLSGPNRRDFVVGSSLWDLAIPQGSRFLYGIDSYRGEVLAIDPGRGVALERCAVPVRPGGRLLLLDPGGGRLFVGNWAPGYVDILE